MRMLLYLCMSMFWYCTGGCTTIAVHMAVGLLFLGGGTQTLGRSDLCIAALLISLYPQFPMESTEERYHCQVMSNIIVFSFHSSFLRYCLLGI